MKIETEEIALKDVVDEMCPDVGYDAKPTAEVVKSIVRHTDYCIYI